MAYSDEQKIGKIWREKSYCQEINLHSVRLKNSDFLDTLTKTAILTTLAGYKQCDYIYVFDKFNRNINLRKLSRYLSYILNHKEFAPRKYNIKVTDAKSFSKKIVILEKIITMALFLLAVALIVRRVYFTSLIKVSIFSLYG